MKADGETVTLDTIPGLTPEERVLYKRLFLGNVDLNSCRFEDTEVDGISLPDIVNGVVIRNS